MKREALEELVSELALPIAKERGVELAGVEFAREGGEHYLRVYIDSAQGVYIDDCTYVSERLSKKLDEVDPIPYSYYLEVSSSGEMPLRKEADFVRFAGRYALINTYKEVAGRKSFQGTLLGLEGGNVMVDVDGEVMSIPLSAVSKARLSVPL